MFPSVFKQLRESKNLTYRELADELNKRYNVKFSKSTIQRWEEGKSSPSIDHASAIAHYFDVRLEQLAGSEDVEIEEAENNDDYTLAAHIDDDVTEEEMIEIQKYIDYIKSQRK